ncbi:UEV domain-containing protein [Paraphysoderma sedebokerense]|nr:UEV domain-containing protein [Paraphysoderma sedebokerense]
MDPRRQWLRQVCTPYPQSNRVYQDVDNVLTKYSSLLPKSDAYVYDDGRTTIQLCLYGTLPIAFRGSTYNIPIEIWVPLTYPSTPPICFVRPTPTMLVKPSQHVDANGKIYHPYLSYWHSRPETATIMDFLEILKSIFSQEPPVYAKPSSSPSAQSPASASTGSPSSSSGGYTPQPQPPYTYPMNQQNFPGPIPMPLPPYGTQPAPVVYPPQTSIATPFSSIPSSASLNQTELLSSAIPNANLPPPLDPTQVKLNSIKAPLTEKLNKRLTEFSTNMTKKMDDLLKENKELNEGEILILEGERRLKEEETKLEKSIEALTNQNKQLSESIAALQKESEVNIDEVFTSTSAVHSQLFELTADENAIEDTMYYLAKGLMSERIDLSTYMKHIRSLAKDQFMRRALIKKIRVELGLPIV